MSTNDDIMDPIACPDCRVDASGLLEPFDYSHSEAPKSDVFIRRGAEGAAGPRPATADAEQSVGDEVI